MEVINESARLLSNFEVLNLLKEIQQQEKQKEGKTDKKHQKNMKYQQNAATISFETIRYLEETPCAFQTKESVENFLAAMKPYNLTKAEKLQLVNHRPTSLVELQLIIEENEDRLSEEQMEEILDIVNKTLPTKDVKQEQDDEMEIDVPDV